MILKGAAKQYFNNLYRRTMEEAYKFARTEIAAATPPKGQVLDCGAYNGFNFFELNKPFGLERASYVGLEWSREHVEEGKRRGLNIQEGDLNKALPYEDNTFDCVFGLSVLEHLLYGCRWIRETKRVLRPGGRLVILTPNISTPFTIAFLLVGKMPSSGPHPDSHALMTQDISVNVGDHLLTAGEDETPTDRHLVVFSYRVLKKYLDIVGFEAIRGRGFGLYPFPNVLQGALERLDPFHCHQMVFVARKPHQETAS